jgi:rhodanese-related sulfurtransferase
MMEIQLILYTVSALILLFYIRRLIQRARMKEYSPKQVAGMLKDDSIILLDVRSAEERNQQHIKGSLHIPVNDLLERLKTLEKYRLREIVCYCHSGSRSFSAALMLQKHGFQAVNMKGGIAEWNYQNLKL